MSENSTMDLMNSLVGLINSSKIVKETAQYTLSQLQHVNKIYEHNIINKYLNNFFCYL